MLKARLPTQQELIELYKEVESLRKEKKLRDDTVKFLQKEKEALQKELQAYEQVWENAATTAPSASRELESENKQLQADVLHLKDLIRRQNVLLKNTRATNQLTMDKKLVETLCRNLSELLETVCTPMSDQIQRELTNQVDMLQKTTAKRSDNGWHFLEVIDRAVLELKAVNRRTADLPDLRASIVKYSGTSNLLTCSSTSLANLSQPTTPSRRRGAALGKLGRLERSRSAPALNGLVPHPPTAPPPSAIKSIYKSDSPVLATVNMRDIGATHLRNA